MSFSVNIDKTEEVPDLVPRGKFNQKAGACKEKNAFTLRQFQEIECLKQLQAVLIRKQAL